MITFKDFNFKEGILSAISELGFSEPTTIQEKAIPAILDSTEDLIALAQTGTGKTAAFGLPIIEKIDTNSKAIQALILCPTRELCMQITKDLDNYCKHLGDVATTAVYGGARIEGQIKSLKRDKVQIVVGTPGRTLDLIKRRVLKIENLRWLVLDEADEMLNMGFREELDAILENTPSEKQTLLFSATMPKEVRRIASSYMKDPTEISAGKKNVGADNVTHNYYVVKASDRYLALKRLADIHPDIYGIIFCRTRSETKDVAAKLINDGYNADALHGDLSQAQRDYVMGRFRVRQLQLLVATDVAARGIDITELTHVINYNMPDDPEVYIHRSGRTGRAGSSGTSIVISHAREQGKIRSLEKITGKKFEHKKIPNGHEICEKRLYNLMDNIEKIEVDDDKITPFLPAIYKKLEWLDKDELLKRLVSVEFNRFLDYYKNAKDLNAPLKDTKNERRRDSSSQGEFLRFHINLGKKHNINPATLIGVINENTRNRNLEIGKIDILRNFSFFEIDKNSGVDIIQSFEDAKYNGTDIEVELSKPSEDKKTYRKDNQDWYDKPKRNKPKYGRGGNNSGGFGGNRKSNFRRKTR